MIKREYTIDQPFELTATPISWLDGMAKEELSAIDDILLVVSKPDYQVQDTHYMSKSMPLGMLRDVISENLSIDLIQNDINQLSGEINALSDIADNLTALVDGEVFLKNVDTDEPINEPYILSSIAFGGGNILSVDGYLLSDALDYLMPQMTYNYATFKQLSCQQLIVNDREIYAVDNATSAVAGLVKVYSSDDNVQNTGNKIYVKYDFNAATMGQLYISKKAIIDTIADDIAEQVKNQVLEEVGKSFFKTKVCATDPQFYEKNTIYFIAHSDISPTESSDQESENNS